MIIEFIETHYAPFFNEAGTDEFTLPGACETKTFLIDTSKIPAFLETEPYAKEKLFFVKPSLTAAADGVTELSVDFAQAFCDETDWYNPVYAEDGAEPEITVNISVSHTF